MDKIKRYKPDTKKYSLDEYSMFYPKSKKDKGFSSLLTLISVLVVIIASTSLVIYSIREEMSALSIIIGVIVIVVFISIAIVGICLSLSQRPHHLNNGESLYALYEDEKPFKIVENFSEGSVALEANVETNTELQEYDENGNPIYYAEELFDDEDDIFINQVNSIAIEKEKKLQYKDIIARLENSFKQYGLNGELARELISTMSFSPMVFAQSIQEFIPDIFEATKNPNFIIHYSNVDNIAQEQTLFNAFEYAKSNQDVPVFVYIDGVPAREFMNYLRPLYAYIDNPNEDYYISNKGSTSYIPHNVYFLVNIAQGDSFFDISRRYLRYIGLLNVNVTKTSKSDEASPCVLSIQEFTNARRNALESHALSESIYKKLDNLFSLLYEASGYILQNKIQRKIEEYSAILLSLGDKEENVVDECLANLIISSAIITNNPKDLEDKYHLIRNIESEFGVSQLKETKATIKKYISIFSNKGGN